MRLSCFRGTFLVAECGPLGYHCYMEIEFDIVKSNLCFERRGFDFEYVAQIFLDDDRLTVEDKRYEYGEKRYNVLGLIGGRLFAVTYTIRAKGVIRIISARKANKREVTRYEKYNA